MNCPRSIESDRLPPGRGRKSVFGAFWGFGQKALRRGTRALSCWKYLRRILAQSLSADESAAVFYLMPVGDLSPAGHILFIALKSMQKTLFLLDYSRQAKLSADNFDAAAQPEQNFPAGRLRTFPSYRSAIFMGHSVYALSAKSGRPTPGVHTRHLCQRKKRPSTLHSHEENQNSPQPIRRRPKTLSAFWRGAKIKALLPTFGA